ncbi:MAG: hypothetical protein WAN89_00860 [Lawsonella sp.]
MANTSRHASGKRPRRVAGWIIASLLVVVVVVAITVAWALVNKSADTVRTEEAIEDCSAGYVTIDIWAPEDVQDSLTALITDYQATLTTDGGLCASFSLSTQPSKEAFAQINARNAFLPGIWIGDQKDVETVNKKHSNYLVTKPVKLKGTKYSITTFDLSQSNPDLMDEVTLEHSEEATQAAIDAETYIKEKGVKTSSSSTTTKTPEK